MFHKDIIYLQDETRSTRIESNWMLTIIAGGFKNHSSTVGRGMKYKLA